MTHAPRGTSNMWNLVLMRKVGDVMQSLIDSHYYSLDTIEEEVEFRSHLRSLGCDSFEEVFPSFPEEESEEESDRRWEEHLRKIADPKGMFPTYVETNQHDEKSGVGCKYLGLLLTPELFDKVLVLGAFPPFLRNPLPSEPNTERNPT